jgi:outer membrane protein assembly factor BamB
MKGKAVGWLSLQVVLLAICSWPARTKATGPAVASAAGAGGKVAPFQGFPVPPGTGTAMFSALTAHPNGKIYMGTCNDVGRPAHLLSLEPKTRRVRALGNMRDVTCEHDKQLIAQSKIHTQLVVDARGHIWFGTHCEEVYTFPDGGLDRWKKGYAGGHLVSYDPKANRFKDHGILFPKKAKYPKDKSEFGESLISMAIDRENDRIYAVTDPHVYFVVFDIKTKKVHNAGTVLRKYPPTRPGFASPRDLVLAADGNVYFFTYEGRLMRYNSRSKALERFKEHIPGSGGGKANMPFQLMSNRSRTKIYGNGSGSGRLFELTVENGNAPRLTDLGPAFGLETRATVIHALTFGPDQNLYYAPDWSGHLYCYNPKTRVRSYLGAMTMLNLAKAKDASAWAACTGPDGVVYFGGVIGKPTEKLGIMAYKPR